MINYLIKACLVISDNKRAIASTIGGLMGGVIYLSALAAAKDQLLLSEILVYAVGMLSMGLAGWFLPEVNRAIKGESHAS